MKEQYLLPYIYVYKKYECDFLILILPYVNLPSNNY